MTPASSSDALISIVVPCYNEQEVFPLLAERLAAIAGRIADGARVELVLVDDGSRDRTWQLIREFAARDPRVRGVALSRNFGHQLALSCGYDVARGDAVLCMDADLQDPPEVMLEMIDRWRQGADVVYAVRARREGETRFKIWTAAVFYRLLRAMGAGYVREDTGDFRLLSRRALDALRSMREQHRFIRGMVGWIGFATAEVVYERKPRAAGTSKYPLRRMLRLAIDATVSFSIVPLRFTFFCAGALSLLVLGYLGYVGVRCLFFDTELVPGWTSLLLSVMAFGALNLVCIGIMGEYVGRIYEQVKSRPLYIVREGPSPDSSASSSRL
jgi:dolichol-phosphate mannosyltransferase